MNPTLNSCSSRMNTHTQAHSSSHGSVAVRHSAGVTAGGASPHSSAPSAPPCRLLCSAPLRICPLHGLTRYLQQSFSGCTNISVAQRLKRGGLWTKRENPLNSTALWKRRVWTEGRRNQVSFEKRPLHTFCL